MAAVSSPWWGPRALGQLAFFRVRKVEVLGARYTPPAEIVERLRVDTSRSVWEPVEPLRQRVAQHPQVLSAVVRRSLPGTLVVELVERTPVALVQGPNGLRAVDERGRALPLDPSRTPVDAPVVVATPRDSAVYHLLGAMLREAPAMYARVTSIRATGDDEMVLQVAGRTVRALTSVPLARLGDMDPVERDLARRRLNAVELDLRYRDQVIARLP